MQTSGEPVQAGDRLELAPAKLNLGLRVVGRRADGYHLIESVFTPIDFADEIRVAVAPAQSPAVRLECRTAPDAEGALDVPRGEANLAWRAALGFLEKSGHSLNVSLSLTKRIPLGAGLGGGSSNAGAVLRALDALVPGALEPAEIRALALSLGADVPFFLGPETALVEGVGERITPIGGVPPLILVLANPGESLATSEVFRAWDALHPTLTSAEPGSTLRSLSDWLAVDPEDTRARFRRLGEMLENDLEQAARRLCPAVGRIKGRLLELGAQAAGMSGSGSTTFGVFSTESEARSAIEELTLRGEAWARLAGTWTGR